MLAKQLEIGKEVCMALLQNLCDVEYVAVCGYKCMILRARESSRYRGFNGS